MGGRESSLATRIIVYVLLGLAAVIMVAAIAIILWPLLGRIFSRAPQVPKAPLGAEEI